MTKIEKRNLINYVRKEIIISLIVDHGMSRKCAKKTLEESEEKA